MTARASARKVRAVFGQADAQKKGAPGRRAKVAIIMGSQSDWPSTMKHAADTLAELGVAYEARIVSAHRTPRVYRTC